MTQCKRKPWKCLEILLSSSTTDDSRKDQRIVAAPGAFAPRGENISGASIIHRISGLTPNRIASDDAQTENMDDSSCKSEKPTMIIWR